MNKYLAWFLIALVMIFFWMMAIMHFAHAEIVIPSDILVSVDKVTQSMIVSVEGVVKYQWKVSTGRPGYDTPSGDYTASSMNELWISKQWDSAPMPHAVFFTKKGHAIHGTDDVRHLGSAASHGCVRLSQENAATLYKLVEENGLENTKVTIAGEVQEAYKSPPQQQVPQPQQIMPPSGLPSQQPNYPARIRPDGTPYGEPPIYREEQPRQYYDPYNRRYYYQRPAYSPQYYPGNPIDFFFRFLRGY